MDGVSIAASAIGIATAGIQVSIKVVTLASQVSTASERVSAIGNDVSLTSSILQQLGELIKEGNGSGNPSILNKSGLELMSISAEVCKRVFRELEEEVSRASQMIRNRKHKVGMQVKLTLLEKAKWPFLQPGIELLRVDLREAKETLLFMLQVNIKSHRSLLCLTERRYRWQAWRSRPGWLQCKSCLVRAFAECDHGEDSPVIVMHPPQQRYKSRKR